MDDAEQDKLTTRMQPVLAALADRLDATLLLTRVTGRRRAFVAGSHGGNMPLVTPQHIVLDDTFEVDVYRDRPCSDADRTAVRTALQSMVETRT